MSLNQLFPSQVLGYRDAEGRSGLQYVVQVATQLLSPATSEHTATFVGRLVTVLVRRAGDHLGDNLDILLRAVLSKLQVGMEQTLGERERERLTGYRQGEKKNICMYTVYVVYL